MLCNVDDLGLLVPSLYSRDLKIEYTPPFSTLKSMKITTLVNAKEKPIKSEKTLRAIVHVGQAVNFAVQKFVSVGEAIADDNCEIKSDMYEACKDARTAGSIIEQLCDVQPDECGQLRSYADKNNMVRAARTLLSSVTRVLLLADTVVVKQLLATKDRVIKFETGNHLSLKQQGIYQSKSFGKCCKFYRVRQSL
ncbi:alpha-catulin [Nephila pilipes]|uniref:Alpha-catulin n=1 Tax=Nephila pilipes TaxID=299642 RepID=A0A8X6T4S9_NEPPI|nr:alpha-catulin [Nephila pilipes]